MASFPSSPLDSDQQPNTQMAALRPTANEQVAAGAVMAVCLVIATLSFAESYSQRLELRPLFAFLGTLLLAFCYLQYLAIFRHHASRAKLVGMMLLATSMTTLLFVIAQISAISRSQYPSILLFSLVPVGVFGSLQCWCGIQNLRWYHRSQMSSAGGDRSHPPWQLSMKEVLATLTILSFVLGIASLLSGIR
jgi:hypothetical protein